MRHHSYRTRNLFICIAAYICALYVSLTIFTQYEKFIPVSGEFKSAYPLIILDAGHGGFDGGAEGTSGTIEKNINLPIALKTQDFLRIFGFQVLMTREEDISTCDDHLNSLSEKKTSDILNRFEIIKNNPGAIFVSIHQNKFPESSSFGAQMFYGPQHEESIRLAEILQNNFIQQLQPENYRLPKKADESVYLMYHSPIPSVLIECGFLSNPKDEALLNDDNYQNKIAFIIAGSLLEYFSSNKSTVTSSSLRQDVA